jgi:hypothetical protein
MVASYGRCSPATADCRAGRGTSQRHRWIDALSLEFRLRHTVPGGATIANSGVILRPAVTSHNFKPIWKPPFISRLATRDRCHLNGLAMDKSKPRVDTAVSRSDILSGWRDRRHEGGVLIEIQTS